jgi:diacylglycerol kinase (ATP)
MSSALPPCDLGDSAGVAANPQKQRTGLSRNHHARSYSLAGLRQGWQETAFRQEALTALVMLPVACWLGQTCVERVLLALLLGLTWAGALWVRLA